MSSGRPDGTKTSPLMGWPVWKAVAICVSGPAFLGGLLWVSSLMVPPVVAAREILIFSVVMVFGFLFFMWSWRSYSWASRVASSAFVALVFLGTGIRAWSGILEGALLWVVAWLLGLMFGLAWLLPALSPAASEVLWREQAEPRSKFGRTALKWVLGLGVGGAGVIGASAGMSLMRSGAAPLAYFLVAICMSSAAVLMSQSFSHQLWPDSPWAMRGGAQQERLR